MESFVTLNSFDMERVMMIIESSQQVYRRHQFYLWSQGVLQSFLPHELLIFGFGDYSAPNFRSDVLARTAILEEDDTLDRELSCLTHMMLTAWQEGGRQPKVYLAGSACPISVALERLGLGNALAHGAKEFSGDSSAFFIFLRIPQPPEAKFSYFADMLMPYLHTALHRMLQSEKEVPAKRWQSGVKLSLREAGIISLMRDGKTNQQIAEELNLSPSTIKNHVQNILRKLEVGNRAQAVAKAVKTRLIDEHGSL